jgi:hypothetical protein
MPAKRTDLAMMLKFWDIAADDIHCWQAFSL